MQAWILLTFAAVVIAVAAKLASGVAADLKRRMAAFHEEDPIVNFFAWFDRVTTLHRR